MRKCAATANLVDSTAWTARHVSAHTTYDTVDVVDANVHQQQVLELR